MPITFTPVSYTTTRTDYTDVEAELVEAATWSAQSKGIDFLSVDFDTKEAAVTFRHQAKSYAADNGLVVKEKRTPETNVTFRFNAPAETTEE
jgi:hypothetical protein